MYPKRFEEFGDFARKYRQASEKASLTKPDMLLFHMDLKEGQLRTLVDNILGSEVSNLQQGTFRCVGKTGTMRCRAFGTGLRDLPSTSLPSLRKLLKNLQKSDPYNLIVIVKSNKEINLETMEAAMDEIFKEAAGQEVVMLGMAVHTEAHYFEDKAALSQAESLVTKGCSAVNYIHCSALERHAGRCAQADDQVCTELDIIRCTAYAIANCKSPPVVSPEASVLLDDSAKCDIIEIAFGAGYTMSSQDLEEFEEHLAGSPGDMTERLLRWLRATGRNEREADKNLKSLKRRLKQLDVLIQKYAEATGLASRQ